MSNLMTLSTATLKLLVQVADFVAAALLGQGGSGFRERLGRPRFGRLGAGLCRKLGIRRSGGGAVGVAAPVRPGHQHPAGRLLASDREHKRLPS